MSGCVVSTIGNLLLLIPFYKTVQIQSCLSRDVYTCVYMSLVLVYHI